METATFAGGCFWCTEAVFSRIKGVKKVVPGYTGGQLEDPTRDQIHSGISEHAEAVNITYDPEKVSYEDLLTVFFHTHDPTQLNRQGADVGKEYRSAIFYHDEGQKKAAQNFIRELEKSDQIKDGIVTTLEPFDRFYEADESDKNFYENNKNSMYCRLVIDPKIGKMKKDLSEYIK